MFSINYMRSIFKVREEIGTDNDRNRNTDTDIIIRFELLKPKSKISHSINERFSFRLLIPNYLIDLEEEESEIYQKIHKNTRYKINRAAQRDNLHCYELSNPTDLEIEEFSHFFDPFARERRIRTCDTNKLKALRDKGALIITYITDKNQQILCYHVYQKDNKQGYLIYSASRRYENTDSSNLNIIGRANRYLHWKDIQSFKKKGCKWYNFGGKVLNEEDKGGQNVNKFKLEYGPITSGFDSRTFYSNSLKGNFGLFFLYLKWKKSHEFKYTKNLSGRQKIFWSSYEVITIKAR